MNTATLPINIYLGGSFDPVHNGHITMLQHVYRSLNSHNNKKEVAAYFLPTSRSPLKTNSTDPIHRLAMLKLATNTLNKQDCVSINDAANLAISKPSLAKSLLAKSHYVAKPHYAICEQEIWQPPPTYTIDTLSNLRCQNMDSSLVFIVGADNIANLAKWREGLQLTQFAHLWIIPRNDWQTQTELYGLLPKPLQAQVTDSLEDLKSEPHGRIYIDSKSIVPIASSYIRTAISSNQSNQAKFALPSPVYSYIIKNNLYHAT